MWQKSLRKKKADKNFLQSVNPIESNAVIESSVGNAYTIAPPKGIVCIVFDNSTSIAKSQGVT
jgi:hypothetical protein